MAFDFPASPALYDEYTSGGVSFTWDGTMWRISTDPAHVRISGDTMTGPLVLFGETYNEFGAVPLKQLERIIQGAVVSDLPPLDPKHGCLWFNSLNGDFNVWYEDIDSSQWVQVSAGGNGGQFLPLSGGVLTGSLSLPLNPPTATAHATNKSYVDAAIASQSLYQGIWEVAANVPDLMPAVANPLHSYSWVAQTVDPTVPEAAPAALPGIGGAMVATGDTIVYNANLLAYEHLMVPAAASAYLPLTGGELTNGIKFVGDGAVHQLWAAQGSAANNGLLEWRKADDTRNAYLGWGSDTRLEFKFETTCTGLNFVNGNISFGARVAAAQDDLDTHLEMYPGSSGLGMNITNGGQWNFVAKHADHAFNFRTGTVNRVIINKDGIGPRSSNNVTYQNGFTGACDFRVNPASVTLRMHHVSRPTAETGATAVQFKICDYPAGVPAPWANLVVFVPLYTGDDYGYSGRHVMVQARTDGLWMMLYAGAAAEDYNANDRMACTISWSR